MIRQSPYARDQGISLERLEEHFIRASSDRVGMVGGRVGSAPAYTVYFCRVCGSPVPEPNPQGDYMEVPAGLLDSDPEIKPDKHIFVEHTPAWDHIYDDLPTYTMTELIDLRRNNT